MLLICVKIFLARIVDVSLGTIRTIMTIKRKTLLASIIAFVEVFIWFVIAKEALNIEVNTIWIPFSYSLGYASGTFIGSFLSNNLVNDEVFLQVIVNDSSIINKIRQKGYQLSIVALKKGYQNNNKELLLIQTKRRKLNDLINYINSNTRNSFMLVNEVKRIR